MTGRQTNTNQQKYFSHDTGFAQIQCIDDTNFTTGVLEYAVRANIVCGRVYLNIKNLYGERAIFQLPYKPIVDFNTAILRTNGKTIGMCYSRNGQLFMQATETGDCWGIVAIPIAY